MKLFGRRRRRYTLRTRRQTGNFVDFFFDKKLSLQRTHRVEKLQHATHRATVWEKYGVKRQLCP